MSYIIAFVSYSNPDKVYPVQCFRTDLKENDEVIVRRKDGKLRNATIAKLQYLNWNCKGRIECKKSESDLNDKGNVLLPKGSPINTGISNANSFKAELRKLGWTFLQSKGNVYNSIFAHTNRTQTAFIFVRRNGIDILVRNQNEDDVFKSYGFYEGSLNDGRFVRHALAHTTFNLFEGVLRFSESFLKNEKDLERYFKPQGSTDKRTDELKEQVYSNKKSEDGLSITELYEICGGDGDGPAYLGDGVWISAGGSLHDWGP